MLQISYVTGFFMYFLRVGGKYIKGGLSVVTESPPVSQMKGF